jgi:hypothetical protein
VGDRSAGCAPERRLKKMRRCPSSWQSDCRLARAFAVNPSRQQARPRRALGIDRSARPSRSALPDDECEPLAQGLHLTLPHGEAAISVGYRTI